MRAPTILLAVLLVFLAATTCPAGPLPFRGPRLNYAGYVQKNADGTVDADTLVSVFNPNSVPIAARVAVFDKYGNKMADDVRLRDGGAPIDYIPAMGLGWVTLGMLLPAPIEPAAKFLVVIYWEWPAGLKPNRGLVAEIKEIIYEAAVQPHEGCWMPQMIKSWSETALSRGWAHVGGVGFSR